MQRIVRSGSERVDVVARTKKVLAVSSDTTYHDAAVGAGRKSPEAVAKLVARFNVFGLSALEPHGRGGPKPNTTLRRVSEFLARPDARPIQSGMERPVGH